MNKNVPWAFLTLPIMFSITVAFYLNDFRIDIIYFYMTVVGLGITYPLTIVFGIPAYFIFKRFNLLNFASCILYVSFVGALAGAASKFITFNSHNNLYMNQEHLVVNGVLTSSAYRDIMQMSLVCAIVGTMGGIIFWKIVTASSDSNSKTNASRTKRH